MKIKKYKTYNEKLDGEIEKAISGFSQHLMSNSKWLRLIKSLIENSDEIKKINFKKVQSDLVGELYLNEKTTFEFDYWQNGFEGNNSFGGWVTFREIEYLFFPRFIDLAKNETQNLGQIISLLNNIGHFNLDLTENSLKLLCYIK